MVFTPEDLGTYMVDVKHGGKDVPGSAFPVDATPIADASKCRITGERFSSPLDSHTRFFS